MATRTRAQLIADADAFFPDNTTGQIDASNTRDRVKDIAESTYMKEDIIISDQDPPLTGVDGQIWMKYTP